jgi:hypothetical protein
LAGRAAGIGVGGSDRSAGTSNEEAGGEHADSRCEAQLR